MFSRAAKSVVKSLGSRRIHIGEKSFKIALIGGTGEISQTLSQLLKNSAKLNALALYDVAAVNRPLPNYNFHAEEPFKPIPSETLTMAKKSCSGEGSRSNAVIRARQTDNNNHQENNGRSQIEKLVEALYRLPIAEEAATFNNPLIPIEEIMPKAGNACGRMRPRARVLGEKDSSNVKTWQRGYATVAIRKCFSDLMYPSFQEHYLTVIPKVKISKKHRSIKTARKITYSSCGALIAKENNRQSLLMSLLNHGEKPARRLMKKFRNAGVPSNIEARCRAVEKLTDWMIPEALSNNKLRLLRKIYSRMKFPSSSLNFINHKRENNREAILFNCDSGTMTDDTLNVVEQENWIKRTCSKIKSILPDLHAKIRLHSTIASDSYCSENIFAVNQVIPFSDIISNSVILSASKDCEDDRPKDSIRKKIQEFCMQRKKSLRKNRDENDICKKRERCKTTKGKYQEREKICEKRKRIDCSEKRKQAAKRQDVDICKGRKSSCDKKSVRDCRKTRERKVEVQEDPCKRKKDDISRTGEDPGRGQRPVKQEQTFYELHDPDPCRADKKEAIKKKDEIKKEEIKRKEEIKKPDCSETKKVEPCEKKMCPPVKKLQPKEENLTVRLQDSGIDKRRERSSSPMKSTVEIAESGKPIESNQIQTNKGSLSVTNSRQQFMGINNLHQDSNLAIDHKDRSDFSFLHKHFVSNLRHCRDREFDESKLSHDRQGNDDYFPQGEEYEEEIGTEDYQLGKKTPSKKPSRLEDEHEKFEPTMLMFENNKYINGGPLTRYITHVYFSSIEELTDADRTMLMSKKVSNKDAVEKLQTLIEKQAVSGRVLRLGEPDCGEDSPGQPKRNPCDPPKGPCQPAEPPGYPSKPKPKRKPFCVKCPPKEPCKEEKC
ncbi:Sex-regulated protein janus-A [Temnothorax longispinosus]|uniref:Sex-regulated protein janus-A n=1 Tax=Temnothorax longispinosus TaxID=300112 RepID=A0A4S2JNJ5_9HYME|nr:Sex-regulated protein janus-A [Temnothorax longispinosus]